MALRRWADSLPEIDPDPALEDEAASALAEGIAGQEEEEERIQNMGNSEGSRKGWETRRARGWKPTDRPKGTGRPKKPKRLESVGAVIDAAHDDPDNRDYADYQEMDGATADAIKRLAGEPPEAVGDLSGYRRTVEAEKVMKILGKHGTDPHPVTEDDFLRLKDYLASPVEQRWETGKRGDPTLVSRVRSGRDLLVVEEVLAGRRRMTLLSMYRP